VTNNGNYLDERIAFHVALFPQPFGIQVEYTFGRGPQLNAARTDVELGSLRGGYVQVFYKYQCDTLCQNLIPFFRVQEYYGGRKFEANAPHNSVREWELGLEYQLNRAVELTVMYTWTQRTSSDSALLPAVPGSACSISVPSVGCTQTPYQLQTGNLLRFQLQWNF
jgi:predicted porin